MDQKSHKLRSMILTPPPNFWHPIYLSSFDDTSHVGNDCTQYTSLFQMLDDLSNVSWLCCVAFDADPGQEGPSL